MKTFRFALTAAVAVCAVSAAVIPSAFAQDKMAPKMAPKMDKKMAPMYVVKETKMAYTEAQAKMMKMKDMKGNKMVKMMTMPKGYKMAPTMDHKMDGGKMAPKVAPKPKT